MLTAVKRQKVPMITRITAIKYSASAKAGSSTVMAI